MFIINTFSIKTQVKQFEDSNGPLVLLQLRAEDRDNPSLFSEAVFVLQLIDLNDNQPVFPQGSLYTFSINEQFYTRPYFVGQVVVSLSTVHEFGYKSGVSPSKMTKKKLDSF